MTVAHRLAHRDDVRHEVVDLVPPEVAARAT